MVVKNEEHPIYRNSETRNRPTRPTQDSTCRGEFPGLSLP